MGKIHRLGLCGVVLAVVAAAGCGPQQCLSDRGSYDFGELYEGSMVGIANDHLQAGRVVQLIAT